MKHNYLLLGIVLLLLSNLAYAQERPKADIPIDHVKELVKQYKSNPKGPYLKLNWYCHDGTIKAAKDPCGDKIGGNQHATYRNEVVELGTKYNLFLGQILTSTDQEAFWDEPHYYSRMKQYQIGKYLESVDDGWIMRKAQFYRGAIQSEDEESWGKDFFNWVLSDDDKVNRHYFMIREAMKDIPHAGDSNNAQKMRSISKSLADEFPSFSKIRIKIHGKPEPQDIDAVDAYYKQHKSEMNETQEKEFTDLKATMQKYFSPIDIDKYKAYTQDITNTKIKDNLMGNLDAYQGMDLDGQMILAAETLWYMRSVFMEEKSSKGRMALMDLSLKLEQLIKSNNYKYKNADLSDLLDQICFLSKASAATGGTELWEWNRLESSLNRPEGTSVALAAISEYLTAARSQLEWSTSKVGALYEDDVLMYASFEPLANGFIDDRIRGSVNLELGNAIGKLGNVINNEINLKNKVFSLSNQSHFHGLNPGYAKGKLIVIEGDDHNMETDPTAIYVFGQVPSDLNPVSGILTVSEGNLVSHVQLLARNLGIPNAAMSVDNFKNLKSYNNKEVFYAVSNKGTVLMKLASEMTATEKKLFSKVIKKQEMITINTDSVRTDVTHVVNLRDVNAKSSGKLCGPKAANMGELKHLFPNHVVEGFVIPFGVFLDHMKQTIPGRSESYWDFLNSIFNDARKMAKEGSSVADLESFQLKKLEELRKLILEMELKDDFVTKMNSMCKQLLGKPLGQVGVFLRSDTNMEDLANFTGAGLNLTLFNVLDKNEILEGIKRVWASPYSARSYKWRQKYLTNPESVFPSILVIPAVNNDYSGVMITKGVASGNPNERTVAFSRGVGGAVDGQIAETWVLEKGKNAKLVSPSREPINKFISPKGGLMYLQSSFEYPIMSHQNKEDLINFSEVLYERMGKNGMQGPYDTELGFKDNKLWLFQIRPFVENANATGSDYLNSISPKIDMTKTVSLSKKL